MGLTLVLNACGSSGTETVSADSAIRDSLGIGPRVALHRIALGGDRDSERIVPSELRVEEGDVVAFETVDGRIHELAFEPDSLAPDILDFLRKTRQLRSPPLMNLGTRFLVDLEDAPEGRYVFRGRTVGDPLFGTILVGDQPSQGSSVASGS